MTQPIDLVAPCATEPHRLWSVLALMEQFHVASLVQLSAFLGRFDGVSPSPGETITLGDRVSAVGIFEEDAEHLQQLGLYASTASIERLVKMMKVPEAQPMEPLLRESQDLKSRLQDELSRRVTFLVDSNHQHFFTEKEPFGSDVARQFQTAAKDIYEAGRCIGLGRSTAAVFHLMRVIEYGLRAVGTSLNDPTINPDTNPTWNDLLQRFDGELRKNPDKRSAEWRNDGPFFSGVASRLYAIKDTWRNPTMHVRGTYTVEEALDIYNNVRGFMQHLATKLHE